MSLLFENPLPLGVAGALAATLALIVFLSRRDFGSLVALGVVIAITLVLILVERLVVTDREQVEGALAGMLAAIEANDASGTVDYIDPAAADIRSDVESLIPLIRVEAANAGSVEVAVDESAQPPTATTTFRAYLHGTHGPSGTPIAYINQRVDLNWVKRSDRWLVDDYTAYYDGQPIDAVGSAAGNRPMSTRSP